MRVVLILLTILKFAGTTSGELVWLEAERPTAGDFPAKNPFAPAADDQRGALSGGAWIGVDGRRDRALFLSYRFDISAAGNYALFARKFWKHGPFRWRIDDGEWHTVGKYAALIDRAVLRKNVEASWVAAGSIDLAAGAHTLRVELTENSGPAAFDCFIITDQPFTPRGKLKPGEKLGQAPAGWFAFEPDEDPFDASPIDLRFLNEPTAGANGRLMARGDAIVHEATGQPIRFWGVNARADIVNLDRATTDRLAKFLAKRGVNLVRIHMPIGDARGTDDRAIASVQSFVASMKTQGIYTAISIYFPVWMKLQKEDGFGAYNNTEPFAIIFFDERFQQLYRSWFKELLTRPNVHAGGLPLGQDPAVALVEMVNEDSLFFWTTKPYQTIPAEPMGQFERRFGEWARGKYGSIDAASEKWNRQRVRGDDFGAGRIGILPLWDIINRRSPRGDDTASFFADLQMQFFLDTQKFLRASCGYNGLTVASNWHTADARLFGPLDKFSNAVADVMDRHGYYGGKHEGERASYAIDRGDSYFDRSAARFHRQDGSDPTKRSFNTPIWDVVYEGKPSITSEINWTAPNRFRAEMPLIAAAYGSLGGSDGFMFFALEGPGWDSALRKFSIQTPSIMGQFPAAALAYRRGYIDAAPTVVRSDLHEPSLRKLAGGPALAQPNLDALREKDIPADAANASQPVTAIDPLAFAVGKVEAVRGEKAGVWQSPKLATLIDRQRGIARSITEQLVWDFGRGVVTINAPRVQAACGFLGAAGKIDLADCTFEIDNDFAAVWLIALDDHPIAQSKKMLLNVVTEEMNNGFAASGEGRRTIDSTGGPPICVKDIDGTVTINGDSAVKITPLDFNGYPAGEAVMGSSIRLERTVMYYLIER